ncbi:hypothetical protein D3C81_2008330 [compost metagenome]
MISAIGDLIFDPQRRVHAFRVPKIDIYFPKLSDDYGIPPGMFVDRQLVNVFPPFWVFF